MGWEVAVVAMVPSPSGLLVALLAAGKAASWARQFTASL